MKGYLRMAGLTSLTFRSTRLSQPLHHPIRQFSVVFRRPRPQTPKPYSAAIPYSRSFWGTSLFSSKSPPVIPTENDDPQASTLVEDTAASTIAPPEPIWADTNEPMASDLADGLSSVDAPPSSAITPDIIPPLQYGDLADLGLIGWNPAGLIRWSLEVIQVSTGMPWFWVIVTGTAFWRVVVFPLTVKASQNAARMAAHAPALEAAKNRLNAAAKDGDPAKKTAAVAGMAEAYAKAGVSPMSMLFVPLAQLPIAFGVFLGIKGMCDFPVEQMKYSGLDLLPDLTAITNVADPYYLLPILAAAMMNIQIKLAARDMDSSKQGMLHIFNALRLFFPVVVVLMAKLPVGVIVSIITGIGMTAATSVVMQRTVVRRMLRLPPLPANPPKIPTFMESRAALYKYLEEQHRIAQAQAKGRKP